MNSDVWNLFPYPTLFSGQFVDGSLMHTHPDCTDCSIRECGLEPGSIGKTPRSCRYGISYARIDDERVVVGVLVTDDGNNNKRAKKRRNSKDPSEMIRHVKAKVLVGAIENVRNLGPGLIKDVEKQRKEILANWSKDPDMQKMVAEHMKAEYRESLLQGHDFLQLVTLVKGHAEVLLHEKYPDLPAEEAAERCPVEGAIYFSTRLMSLRINSLTYLNEINLAHGEASRIQIHSLMLSFLRIYKFQAMQKNLRIELGSCLKVVHYNSQALSTVILGILDNLVKYAPSGSAATVDFIEKKSGIQVCFTSLGPKIESSELSEIFELNYRAVAAKDLGLSGQGLGLTTAKAVSDALELDLKVAQTTTADSRFHNHFSTTFSFVLRTEK
jgi:K+-sensing histidine kinase KdpD